MNNNHKTTVLVFTLLAATVLIANAGLLDKVFDSEEVKRAKQNDAWYAANKDSIKVNLKTALYGTNESLIYFDGTIENGSPNKLTAIVIEVVILNKENGQEALRERMQIAVPAFKSETYNLKNLSGGSGSQLVSCLNRIKDHSWSYQLITVIPNMEDKDDDDTCFGTFFWAKDYYKINSIWNESGKH